MKFEEFEKKHGHWLKHVPDKEYSFLVANFNPHWVDVIDKTIRKVIEKL